MLLRSCTVDKCTANDPQCVKDCCHLEGDTPIEIRIAYQPPHHPTRPHGPSHLAGLHPNLARLRQSGHGGSTEPFDDRYLWAPHMSAFPSDVYSEKMTPWHRAADVVRPALGSTRWSLSKDDFDHAAFASPDDDRSVLAGSSRQPGSTRMESVPEACEDSFFPEIVRSREKASPGLADPVNDCTESPAKTSIRAVSSDADSSAGTPVWGGMVVARADSRDGAKLLSQAPNVSACLSNNSHTPVGSARSPDAPVSPNINTRALQYAVDLAL